MHHKQAKIEGHSRNLSLGIPRHQTENSQHLRTNSLKPPVSKVKSPPLTNSNNSTSSNISTPKVKFECEENAEDLNPQLLLGSPKPTKSSSSFIQEIHGVQPPPPEYEPLEVEEEDFSPSTLWRPRDSTYFHSLLEKELEYMSNPYCLESMQPYINSFMRAILFDWMMEVCAEFTLKRETFHLSVSYVDRILSTTQGIKKDEFQLVGLTCMYIAAKVEEIYPPKTSDWARSADNGYSVLQIKQMEKLVLNKLNWKLVPGTVHNWVNWLMNEWDSFVEYHFGCVYYNKPKDFEHLPSDERKKQQKLYEKRFIVFKHSNQQAYKRFRETMQILDVTCLDANILKHPPRLLAAGILYLMISKYFYETNYQLLYYNGPDYEEPSPCLALNEYDNISLCFGDGTLGSPAKEDFTETQNFESASVVQELYSGFISAALQIKNCEEIYQSVAYFHPFLEFEVVFDLPVVCKIQSKARLESHYEEFLSYQTHNPKNMDFVSSLLQSN